MRAQRHPVEEAWLLRLTQLLADEWHHVHIAWPAERTAALVRRIGRDIIAEELGFEAEARVPVLTLEEVSGEVVQRGGLVAALFHLVRQTGVTLPFQHGLVGLARV